MYFIIQKLIFNKHLEEGEQIYFVAHKHWVAILVPLIKTTVFGFLTPWLLFMLFGSDIMFYIAVIWASGGFIKLLYELTDWYCDAWLVTSMGVIDLEWKGLFDHTSSRIEFPSIEGVSYQFKGFWQTMIRFGRTQIDKVSANNPTVLELASNPKNIELNILKFKNKFEEERGRTESSSLKELLSNLVLKHMKGMDLDLDNIDVNNPDIKKLLKKATEENIIPIENLD